jgi:wyosine [tRNA(Phe)-imidazoG37] synthetase (radical SAM superfamily)
VESVFVEGPGGNTNEYDVEEWIDRLAALHPKHVTVTTVAEPPLDPDLRRAHVATLERIAARLRTRTGIAATALP